MNEHFYVKVVIRNRQQKLQFAFSTERVSLAPLRITMRRGKSRELTVGHYVSTVAEKEECWVGCEEVHE